MSKVLFCGGGNVAQVVTIGDTGVARNLRPILVSWRGGFSNSRRRYARVQQDGTQARRLLWKPTFPTDHTLCTNAAVSPSVWKTAIDFLSSLVWECKPEHQTAYIELAFAAWYAGVRLEGIQSCPRDYATVIRKCINQCVKLQSLGLIIPGTQKSCCKSRGRTTPAGLIQGVWPHIHPTTLKYLALCFFKGRSQRLSDWGDVFQWVLISNGSFWCSTILFTSHVWPVLLMPRQVRERMRTRWSAIGCERKIWLIFFKWVETTN